MDKKSQEQQANVAQLTELTSQKETLQQQVSEQKEYEATLDRLTEVKNELEQNKAKQEEYESALDKINQNVSTDLLFINFGLKTK